MKQPLLAVGVLLGVTTFNTNASLTSYAGAGNVGLVYSSVSDITWTGDANLLGTLEANDPNLVSTIISTVGSITDTPNNYDTPANSGIHTLTTADFEANGLVSWFGAQAFVSYLNTINYAGSNQWALPDAGVNPQWGYNQTGSQLGQLYYNELNALGYPGTNYGGYGIFRDGNNTTSGNAGPFNNVHLTYWSGTEYASFSGNAWSFYNGSGNQGASSKIYQFDHYQIYAWAVSPGQVSAVPVPGAVWLFGTGLVGLLSLKRRRAAG